MRLRMRLRMGWAAPLVALVLGCAGSSAQRVPERAAGHAHPEPDPACHGIVQHSLVANHLEQVSVRVALEGEGKARIELLAPELTPAEAAEVRRAFADCAWRPGEGGARTGTITFQAR